MSPTRERIRTSCAVPDVEHGHRLLVDDGADPGKLPVLPYEAIRSFSGVATGKLRASIAPGPSFSGELAQVATKALGGSGRSAQEHGHPPRMAPAAGERESHPFSRREGIFHAIEV